MENYNDTNNLKQFLAYLKKYLPAFVFVTALALAGTFFYSKNLKTPLYQSTAKVVLVQQNETVVSSQTALNDINVSQKLTSTYTEIAKSELVLEQVIADLNLDTTVKDLSKNITVSTVDSTTILSIAVKSETPDKASEIANKIAEVFTKEITKIYNLDNVTPLTEAKPLDTPINNTLVRDLIIAAFLSVFGVTALAFLLSSASTTP